MLKQATYINNAIIRNSNIKNSNHTAHPTAQKASDRISVIVSPSIALLLGISVILPAAMPVLALPPPEDTPEEVLRTEIITEARSPVDGEWLTAAEYAELEAELQRNPELYNSISPQIRHTIFLLQIRRAVRSVAPFLLP